MALRERIKYVTEQLEQLREKGLFIAGQVVAEGQEGIKELRQAGERLKPVLRSVVDDSVAAVREWVDEANQFLADRAVPSYRKARVSQKRLEEKIQTVVANVRQARSENVAVQPPQVKAPQAAEPADTPKAEPLAGQAEVKKPRARKTKVEAGKKASKAASAPRGATPKKATPGRVTPRTQAKTTEKPTTKAARPVSRVR